MPCGPAAQLAGGAVMKKATTLPLQAVSYGGSAVYRMPPLPV